tara:strand:- start:1290 stop:3482 length:2193 start_codon:yes stop_codon:yes gene_type:complete
MSQPDCYISSSIHNADIAFFGNDAAEVFRIDGSAKSLLVALNKKIELGHSDESIYGDGTDIHFGVGSGGDINIPSDIGLTFGDDGEKIEGDGTDLTINSSGLLNLTPTTATVQASGKPIRFGGSTAYIQGDNSTLSLEADVIETDSPVTASVGLHLNAGGHDADLSRFLQWGSTQYTDLCGLGVTSGGSIVMSGAAGNIYFKAGTDAAGKYLALLNQAGNNTLFSVEMATGNTAIDGNLTIGAGTDGTDYTLTFNGNDADGVMTWMEDEDYFKFSDDVFMNSTEKLYFNDTGMYINGAADGQLVVKSDGMLSLTGSSNDGTGGVTIYAGHQSDNIVISGSAINIESFAGVLQLQATGSTNSKIQMTSSGSIEIASLGNGTDCDIYIGAGNFDLNSARRTSNVFIGTSGDSAPTEIDLSATTIDINGSDRVDINGNGGSSTAIILSASHADGGIDVDAGTNGITIDSDGTVSIDAAAASNFSTSVGALTLAGVTLDVDATGGAFNIAGTAESTVTTSGGALNLDGQTGVNIQENGTTIIQITDNRHVLILSGGASTSPNESAYPDTNFFVSGTIDSVGTSVKGTSVFGGDVVISGSLYAKQKHIASCKYSAAGTDRAYVRWNTTGQNATPGVNNKFVAPYDGILIKVMARTTVSAGSTTVSFHKNTDGNATISTTATSDATVNMASADTTYEFEFGASSTFSKGNILGLGVDPTDNPSDVDLTVVFEFTTY